MLQLSTPNTQPHQPPQPAPLLHEHVPVHPLSSQSPQPLHLQPHPPQYPSPSPPPNPPISTPSQPQAEAAQPPSSSQPSSSQLMSVPVTSQAMPGPSPQLSQDVATLHPLQVGEQQVLQGQPPLQHTPSHQPQTVAQSWGTGSQSLSTQPEPEQMAPSLPNHPQTGHLFLHGLQPISSLHQVTRQHASTPTSRDDQHITLQHVQPRGLAPHPNVPPQPLAGRGIPTSHPHSVIQQTPKHSPQYTPYPISLSYYQQDCNVLPLTNSACIEQQPQTPQQPFSVLNASYSSRQSMCLPSESIQYFNEPALNPQVGSSVVVLHQPQAGQHLIQGQPQLQDICSHEPQAMLHQSCSASPAPTNRGPPQAKRVCFESPMAQYIDYVKTLYQRSEVEKKLNAIKWPPTPSTVYINLVCVDRTTPVSKQETDECTRAMVCDGSVDVILRKKRSIDFSDIARNVPASEKKIILVEGAPGVGKSTFSWEFCRRWERGEIAQHYQLVLLLRLRDKEISKAQTLSDLLHHPSKAVVQAVEDDLIATLGANTLIILEGFDELPSTCRTEPSVFFRLINGTLLPHATVLVTSRPWATQDIQSQYVFQHIEILGFTGKQIEKYVTSVFKDEGKCTNDEAKKNIKEVMSYIKTYPRIIPLNAAIVVCVYQESKAGKYIPPRTLTELYYALIRTLLLRYLYGHQEYGKKRWKIQSLKEDLPRDVYSKLLALSELAYSGIYTDQEDRVQLIFTNLPEGFETLGLMQSVPQLYVTQGEDMSYNFLHLTVQEFLAALHISNMSPEKQLKHFQRQEEEERWVLEEGRWRVVLRFFAGITKLARFSLENLRVLLLEEPETLSIVVWGSYHILAGVEVSVHNMNCMLETQRDDIIPLVLKDAIVEFNDSQELSLWDYYYYLGCCIVNSHSHWVLSIQGEDDYMEEEEVKRLVAGVDTRRDTSAKVVGLRGSQRSSCCSGGYDPLFISSKALNALFTGLQDVIQLLELDLHLPVKCDSITWPKLSELRILHLGIESEKTWRLETLLPHLSLEALKIQPTSDDNNTLVLEDCVAIGLLLSASNCLECLHFEPSDNDFVIHVDTQGMDVITKAMSDNESLPLKTLKMRCKCTITDTAAHSLAEFITNSTILHCLRIAKCTINAHGLLELAQVLHRKYRLQDRDVYCSRCKVNGDAEATDFVELLDHYPHIVGSQRGSLIQFLHISDRGAETIATALHHNSTLMMLDLSNNSIGDVGSAALAQALHHNSTLLRLDLSNNSIGDAGSAALAQALHHNSTLQMLDLSGNDAISAVGTHQLVQALVKHCLVLPRGCEKYAMEDSQYSKVKNRIKYQ